MNNDKRYQRKHKEMKKEEELTSMQQCMDWIRKPNQEKKNETIIPFSDLYKQSNEVLKKEIMRWVSRTPFKAFAKAIGTSVLGQANLSILLFSVYHYLSCISNGQPTDNQNVLLTGPSGCGKTETYRALKKYFASEIPHLAICIVDTNQITNEGFIGKDTKHIVAGLKEMGSDGWGIIFLDEFDKRIVKMSSSNNENINLGIQGQMLMVIEGYTINGVDTRKSLFVGLGSFNEAREKRLLEKHIGFGVVSNDAIKNHYSPITREEMIKLGALYELIARFALIISFGPLSTDALDRIIDMRVSEVSESYGVKISISESMRIILHKNSNTEYGNRLIESLIREAATKAMVKILSEEISANEIIITGENEFTLRKFGRELQKSRKQMEI